MPVVQINTNIKLDIEQKQSLLLSAAQFIAATMKKPLTDVMVFYTCTDFVMDGSFEPAAFIDLRCLSGLQTDGVTQCLCEGLLEILQQFTQIDPARVYINFFEVCPEYAWRFRDGMAVCPKSNLK